MEAWWIDVGPRFSNWERFYSRTNTGGGQTCVNFPLQCKQANIKRHLEGSVIVYCDGHAKWQRWENICSGERSYDFGRVCKEGELVQQY